MIIGVEDGSALPGPGDIRNTLLGEGESEDTQTALDSGHRSLRVEEDEEGVRPLVGVAFGGGFVFAGAAMPDASPSFASEVAAIASRGLVMNSKPTTTNKNPTQTTGQTTSSTKW